MTCFADRLIKRTRELGHPLCVGIDPYLSLIPIPLRLGTMAPGHPDTNRSVEEFCCRFIDLIAPHVAVVKPQASLFECLGWQGWQVLDRVIRYAREVGLLVLLDAKRGDIADTARGYAQAYLANDAPMAVDALTVNPYLGPASLGPFFEAAERADRGVIVLVRNSSPDSSVYQSLSSSSDPLFMVVASSLAVHHDRLLTGDSGWSSLGVTVAATHAEHSEMVRSVLPNALFLVLGYGAQGASARDAVRGFRRGPAGLEGGMVSSSRPILFPVGSSDAGLQSWKDGVRNALAKATAELGEAVG